MFRFKILALIALFTFALGLALAGEAVAGQKVKFRVVWHNVKWETVNVPVEEGRILYLFEAKAIVTVLQGNKLLDGMLISDVGCGDMNTKTGTGSGHGVNEWTDRDGDKIYWTWEGNWTDMGKGVWSGPITIVRGTGKFERLKGNATYTYHAVAPKQAYADWDGELEWPR
jgi:hypothetical protein